MSNLERAKFAFVAFFTAVNSALGVMSIPVYILVGSNIFDYFTGILASVYRGEAVSSYRGFRGIAKKVCMWLLVGVGFVLDYAVATVGGQLGIRLEINCLVSTAVVFWLVANEIISILENISDIGTPLPPFLMELVQLLKSKTEDSVTFQGEDVGE